MCCHNKVCKGQHTKNTCVTYKGKGQGSIFKTDLPTQLGSVSLLITAQAGSGFCKSFFYENTKFES